MSPVENLEGLQGLAELRTYKNPEKLKIRHFSVRLFEKILRTRKRLNANFVIRRFEYSKHSIISPQVHFTPNSFHPTFKLSKAS